MWLQVDELISNTLLNVDMEEKVYTSVINWVKHEPSERKKFVARVSKVLYYEFIRCFHQFVSQFFFKNFSQFEHVEKNKNFLLVKKGDFFSQSAYWKRNIRKKKIGIRDWWNYLMNPSLPTYTSNMLKSVFCVLSAARLNSESLSTWDHSYITLAKRLGGWVGGWVEGFCKWPFLLTFRTVFMLI
jgi:hypothetical protein